MSLKAALVHEEECQPREVTRPLIGCSSHVFISQAEFPRQLEAERHRRIASLLK